MRRLIAAIVLAIGISVPAALPASGAATGRIEGKVVNQTTGRPQGGVRLVLTTGTESGESEVAGTTRTGDDGRYVFDDLPTGADRFYALDARFDGGLFAGRPVNLPANTDAQPVIKSELRVWDTTSEPGVIAIRRDDLFVVHNDDGVGVIEAVTITNTSDTAYIGRGAEMLGRDSSGASFAFSLPAGAADFSIIDSTLDVPELVDVDQGVAATIAIPPGEVRTTFSYRLDQEGGSFDLSRPALYPILEMSIFAADPLEIRSNRLVAKGEVELEGKTYKRWSATDPIDAGDPLQAIAVAGGDVPVLPFIVAGAALFTVIGVIAWLVRRKPKAPKRGDRNELLEKVAVLDLAYEAGDIDKDRWGRQRSALLAELRELEGAGR